MLRKDRVLPSDHDHEHFGSKNIPGEDIVELA